MAVVLIARRNGDVDSLKEAYDNAQPIDNGAGRSFWGAPASLRNRRQSFLHHRCLGIRRGCACSVRQQRVRRDLDVGWISFPQSCRSHDPSAPRDRATAVRMNWDAAAGAQVCSNSRHLGALLHPRDTQGLPGRASPADLERAADRLGIYQLGETPRPERGLGVEGHPPRSSFLGLQKDREWNQGAIGEVPALSVYVYSQSLLISPPQVSLPLPPVSLSNPGPPVNPSFPALPLMTSLPPFPLRNCRSCLPRKRSSKSDP